MFKYYFKSKSKKYLLATLLITVLCPLIAFSYSSFIFSSDNYRTSEMYIGSLMYSMKINNNAATKITAVPGKSEHTIEITSLNSVPSFYKLIYKTNQNILVEYNNETIDEPKGEITNKREILIRITNSSSSNIEVEFDVAAGYITNTIEKVTIPSGYTEVTGVYVTNDISIIAIYVDGVLTNSLDSEQNYELDNYTCTNNETVSWDNDSKALTVTPLTESTECTVYFKVKNNPTLYEKILADNNEKSDANINFAYTSEGNSTDEEWNDLVDTTQITNGLYYTANGLYTEDYNNDGTGDRVYYFRGNVINNNVIYGKYAKDFIVYRGYHSSGESYFDYVTQSECTQDDFYNNGCQAVKVYEKDDEMCWRIIRTNEDDSVRLKYNGVYKNGTCPVTGTNVGLLNLYYPFNESSENENYNEYVWDDGTGESYLKTVIDEWYSTSGLASYSNNIANVPYCNDKSNPSSSDDNTYYGATHRLFDISNWIVKANARPTFKCERSADKFTVSGDNWGGNGKLTYPIATMTADEASFAGAVYGQMNETLYLNMDGTEFWTMSPYYMFNFMGTVSTGAFSVSDRIGTMDVNNENFIIPVISLKATSTVSDGTGNYTTPYRIE